MTRTSASSRVSWSFQYSPANDAVLWNLHGVAARGQPVRRVLAGGVRLRPPRRSATGRVDVDVHVGDGVATRVGDGAAHRGSCDELRVHARADVAAREQHRCRAVERGLAAVPLLEVRPTGALVELDPEVAGGQPTDRVGPVGGRLRVVEPVPAAGVVGRHHVDADAAQGGTADVGHGPLDRRGRGELRVDPTLHRPVDRVDRERVGRVPTDLVVPVLRCVLRIARRELDLVAAVRQRSGRVGAVGRGRRARARPRSGRVHADVHVRDRIAARVGDGALHRHAERQDDIRQGRVGRVDHVDRIGVGLVGVPEVPLPQVGRSRVAVGEAHRVRPGREAGQRVPAERVGRGRCVPCGADADVRQRVPARVGHPPGDRTVPDRRRARRQRGQSRRTDHDRHRDHARAELAPSTRTHAHAPSFGGIRRVLERRSSMRCGPRGDAQKWARRP